MTGKTVDLIDLVDGFGRPRRLEDRLAVFADVLWRNLLASSEVTVRAMAWWDECLSPVLGTEVDPMSWRDSNNGPVAVEIDDVLAAWRLSGDWTPAPNAPAAAAVMRPSQTLIDRSIAISEIPVFQWLTFSNPWWETQRRFLEALIAPSDVTPEDGLCPVMFVRDVATLLRTDPVYVNDSWRVHGPAAARSPMLPDDDRFVGNTLEHLARRRGRTTWPDPHLKMSCTTYLAANLVYMARSRHARLGSTEFMAMRGRLSAVETRIGDDTECVFRENGRIVGRAHWRTVDHEIVGIGRTVKRNTLTHFEVDPVHTGRGIGTYIVRHAQARSCLLAKIPADLSPAARSILSWHGWPTDDPEVMELDRVEWPTCRTVSVVVDPRPEESATIVPIMPRG